MLRASSATCPSMRHRYRLRSAATGRAPSRSILLLLLQLRMARCQARVHSGRKSAHRAQGAFRAADVFVCPDDRSRLRAGSTRRSACPQQAATLPAFSTRSRGRSATCVAESSRLPILTSARARLVQRLFPPPERARGCPPAVTAGRPASIGWLRACTSSPAALHCHLLLGCSLDPCSQSRRRCYRSRIWGWTETHTAPRLDTGV